MMFFPWKKNSQSEKTSANTGEAGLQMVVPVGSVPRSRIPAPEKAGIFGVGMAVTPPGLGPAPPAPPGLLSQAQSS